MLTFMHIRGDDQTPYFNKTKRHKGYCTIIDVNNTDAEFIQGLVKNLGGIGIKINGYCEMEQGDDVLILGKWYRVHDFQQKYDKGATRIRADYSRLTGTTYVFLEG